MIGMQKVLSAILRHPNLCSYGIVDWQCVIQTPLPYGAATTCPLGYMRYYLI